MMNDAIIVSIISAIATVLGVLITNRSSQKLMLAEMDKKLALHEQKFTLQIEELTRETRKHNSFAERIPVMQEQINELQRRA